MSYRNESEGAGKYVIWGAVAIVAFIVVWLAIGPHYRLWSAEMRGRATLAEATNSRQVEVEKAKARMMAATDMAEAERIQAAGIRDANETIAKGLGGPQGYLQYLSIKAIEAQSQNPNAVLIYIPTEGGIPVTEAGRALSLSPAKAKVFLEEN